MLKLNDDGIRQWNTFIGGEADNEFSEEISINSEGDIILAGGGGNWGEPIRPFSSTYDALVVKVGSDGYYHWHTYMGSGNNTFGHAVAANVDGKTLVTGYSQPFSEPLYAPASSDYNFFYFTIQPSGMWDSGLFSYGSENFIGLAAAADEVGNYYIAGMVDGSLAWAASPVRSYSGGSDAIVMKFSPTDLLVWYTYLGSVDFDEARGLTVDGFGNVYVAGTSSDTWSAPDTILPYQGGNDAFAAKLDSSGNLLWNIFLGSAYSDEGTAIGVDSTENVTIAGNSNSPWGSPLMSWEGGYDGFLMRVSNTNSPMWLAFMGSVADDFVCDIAVTLAGDVYATGSSDANWGVAIDAFSGGRDAFAARFNSNGVRQWNTFLGSPLWDQAKGIDLDPEESIYLAGTSQDGWGLPIRSYNGSLDAFVTKINGDGGRVWNMFLGSSKDDYGEDLSLDASGSIYLAGTSYGSWGDWVWPFDGQYNAFVARLAPYEIFLPLVIK